MSTKNSKIKKKSKPSSLGTALFGRMSTKDQALFAKRLSFLIAGGVPIHESLAMIARQAKGGTKKRIFEKVKDDVASGKFLSASMMEFRGMFGDFAIQLIRVGEKTGVLTQNLAYLADELKKKRALKQKIVSALIYPIIITVATVAMSVMLTVYIFPKILPIFSSLNVKLPITTRILIAVSNFMSTSGWILGLGILVFIVVFAVLLKRSERFHLLVDRFMIKIPIAGHLMQGYNLTNFCRTFSLMLRGGVPYSEAVKITADTFGNRAYRKEIGALHAVIIRGEKMSKHLEKRRDLFPDIMTYMITVGETSGNLPETLSYLAEMYESEVEDMTKNLSSSIEPILMVFMGVIVGFIAISVITPIYEITQGLQR